MKEVNYIIFLTISIIVNAANAIFGGTNAIPGDLPYHTMVTSRGANFNRVCGGAILSSKWIITACHCVNVEGPAEVIVIPGDVKVRSHWNHYFKSDAIFCHSGYLSLFITVSGSHDIALVHLEESIPPSRTVHPISLVQSDSDLTDKLATLAGWGAYLDTNDIWVDKNPSQLQKIQLPVSKKELCNQYLISSQFLCSVTNKNIGPDHGDSGGPLVLNNEIIGILVSIKFIESKRIAVYSDISYYKPWILEVQKNYTKKLDSFN